MPKSALVSLIALTAACIAAEARAEPDITGMWYVDQAATPRVPAALTPQAAAADKADAAERAKTGRLMSEAHIKCWPTGMPQMMVQPFGLEILQTRGRITVLNEVSTLPRTVYMDRAAHPQGLEPSWNGHSIGRWEGDTLVIDTVGLNGRHLRSSPSLHIVERITLSADGKTLYDEITQEDPSVFAQPYTVKYSYNRLPEGSELMEYVCEVDPQEFTKFEAENPSSVMRHPGGGAGHPVTAAK